MDATTGPIVGAIASPIVAALIGLIIARTGIAAELRRVEYYLKRAELIEKLLALRSLEAARERIPADPLLDELSDIADAIQFSSIRRQDEDQLAFDSLPWWKRFYRLPRPRTVGGWIGSGIFYLYGIAAVAYVGFGLAMLFSLGPSPEEMPPTVIFGATAISFLLAWLGRRWAVTSARGAARLHRKIPGAQGEGEPAPD